jgi:hypothetical protein
MTAIIVPLILGVNSKIKRYWNIYEFVKRSKLCFSKHDTIGSKFIGLDALKRKLFYIEHSRNKPTCTVINLKEVEKCTIKRQYNNIGAGELKKRNLQDFLTTIFLQLRLKNNPKLIDLPFFEKEKGPIANLEELEAKAYAWETAVSNLLISDIKERA